MVDTLRLRPARTHFDIVREAILSTSDGPVRCTDTQYPRNLTLIAAYNARAISLSCSNLGLLPRISGSQNWGRAAFIWPILPCAGGGAFTHCDGSRPTPHTIYACVSVLGVRWLGFTLSCDGIGWVMREWSDEVRLGITSELSPWVGGRSRVEGRTNTEWSRSDGPMLPLSRCFAMYHTRCGSGSGVGVTPRWPHSLQRPSGIAADQRHETWAVRHSTAGGRLLALLCSNLQAFSLQPLQWSEQPNQTRKTRDAALNGSV